MDNQTPDKNYPETVSEAVDRLVLELPQIDKVRISSMDEHELIDLHFSLGMGIRNDFGLWAGNKKLMESCREISGDEKLHIDDASLVIIRELWDKLGEINQIRRVK